MLDFRKVPLFHITHVANLEAIISGGRLISRNRLGRTGLAIDASDRSIQRRRREVVIPGTDYSLHDCVPWFFCIRPPMLHQISVGGVPGAAEKDMVYLVSNVAALSSTTTAWWFTNRHAINTDARWSSNIKDIQDGIDWKLMRDDQWFFNPSSDRMARRQAEFLVLSEVGWNCVDRIAVANSSRRLEAEGLVKLGRQQGVDHNPVIELRPDWYERPSG